MANTTPETVTGLRPCLIGTSPEPTTLPKVGMLISVRGVDCRIVHIHSAGTLDVTSLDGSKSFRLTGLMF